jgi:hypothetical protein
MKKDNTILYTDFLGLGYRYLDVHTNVLLIFQNKKSLIKMWSTVVKWWPDDEIKMRFVDHTDYYDFVLYGESRILQSNWIFMKSLKTSEHYKRFKTEFDDTAYLGFAHYTPKIEEGELFQLEIFKYRKKVTNVLFLNESDAEQDEIVMQSRRIRSYE